MRTTHAVVTTTWNSIDLIERYLTHYQAIGFDHAMLMDFASTDGTREVLTSNAWRGFVDVVPFPGIDRLDSSNMMLPLAHARYGPDAWCLFCDPDELLVTPSMSIDDPGLAHVRSGAAVLSIPRFNVTGLRSIARQQQDRMSAIDALTLRIDRRATRSIEVDIRRDTLDPPWIFTAIPGKAFVRLGSTTAIGAGDHTASTDGIVAAAPDGMYLLHYPFRRYSTFLEKLAMARINFDSNPQHSDTYGWQIRRWLRLSERDTLYDEYLQQFIADSDAERLIGDGTLVIDENVVRFHQRRDVPA